jgi:predicted RecB family nuclease
MHFIDGTRIKEYFTCPRLPYLAFHRDRDEVLPDTPRSKIYFATGRRVEAELLATSPHEVIEFPRGDFEAGFRATQAAMSRKAPALANGVFKLGEFVGRPDLLLYAEDIDAYEVADIKSTMVTKTSARMQVAFYSRMLAQFANPPRRGHVILRDGSRDTFELAAIAASLAHVIERLQSMRRSAGADPGACWQEHCLDCRYRVICAEDLAAADSVAQLPGITRAQVESLAMAGVATVGALADPSVLDSTNGRTELPPEQVRTLAGRAVALLEGKPIRLRSTHGDLAAATFGLAALYSERLAEPHVALAGVVFAEPTKQRVRMLRTADSPDAAANLSSFIENVARSSGPIVIYGDAVKKALHSALARYAPTVDVRRIEERLFDLKAELRRTFAMPSFDRTVMAAASAFGVDRAEVDAEAITLGALSFVEGEPGGDESAVAVSLQHELSALTALRAHLLERGVA